MQHRQIIEGVHALGQPHRACQQIPDRTVIHHAGVRQALLDALAAPVEQLLDPPGVQAVLGGAGPDLLSPRVGLKAVLLALSARERRRLPTALAVEADALGFGGSAHLVPALGEVLDHSRLDPHELAGALVDLAPLKAEALADECAQVRLVERPPLSWRPGRAACRKGS